MKTSAKSLLSCISLIGNSLAKLFCQNITSLSLSLDSTFMDINSIPDISIVNFVTVAQVIMCLSLVWLLQTITSQLHFALWEHMRN